MAQFDVYHNPSQRSCKRAPYLVEVQGNFCDILSTCVVIPLVVQDMFIPAPVLNPEIIVNGSKFLLCTAEITALLRARLGRTIGSVKNQNLDIMNAIDRLLL